MFGLTRRMAGVAGTGLVALLHRTGGNRAAVDARLAYAEARRHDYRRDAAGRSPS